MGTALPASESTHGVGHWSRSAGLLVLSGVPAQPAHPHTPGAPDNFPYVCGFLKGPPAAESPENNMAYSSVVLY